MKFGKLFDLYVECHLKQHSQHWAKSISIFDTHMMSWKEREAEDIKKYEIMQWRAQLNEKFSEYTANRTHQLMRAVFNWGIQADAINCSNPAARIGRFKEKSRERFLQTSEFQAFHSALEKQHPTCRDAFLMMLYTSARKTNVLSMRWEQVDFARSIWTIPKTKNGDPLHVPLIPESLDILTRRFKSKNNSGWVFESRVKGRPWRNLDPAWRKLTGDAKLEDFRIHDLRRTVPSHQAINGVNLTTISATLGHRSIKSTMIYGRLGSTEPVRQAIIGALSYLSNAVPPAAQSLPKAPTPPQPSSLSSIPGLQLSVTPFQATSYVSRVNSSTA